MQMKMNKKKVLKAENGLTLQPMVYAIMPEEMKFSKFIVAISDILYEFNNLLEAVTCCFASHFLLNLNYMAECFQIWSFIQRFFFEIVISEPNVTRKTKAKKDRPDAIENLINLL